MCPFSRHRGRTHSAEFSDRCRNFSQFWVSILHEFGKVSLQVAQLRKSGLGVTGAGNPLGQLPPGAEGLNRSHPLNS